MRNWRIADLSEWKRDKVCGEGTHNCLDTGRGDQCCKDDTYCYIDVDGQLGCCPLDSNCITNSVCKSDSYYCGTTTTTVSPSATAANATNPDCCRRVCPVSQYLCPASLGGNCCAIGWECRANRNCVGPLHTTSSTTSTTSTTATAIATSSSSPTPHCSEDVCASTTPGAAAGSSSEGLSAGIRTGIALAAVAGAGVLCGVIAWLWVLRRDGRARVAAANRVSEVPGDGVPPVGYSDETTAAEAATKRVVPLQPNSPADIASPVELDSAAPVLAGSGVGGARAELGHTEVYELDATEDIVGYRNIAMEDLSDEESTF